MLKTGLSASPVFCSTFTAERRHNEVFGNRRSGRNRRHYDEKRRGLLRGCEKA